MASTISSDRSEFMQYSIEQTILYIGRRYLLPMFFFRMNTFHGAASALKFTKERKIYLALHG